MRKRVVVIGGGTGSYNLLRGLKKYAARSDEDDSLEISAIVTMMDSGGSSGILRDEYGILPPGDLRRCLIALSDETEIMKHLFQYRFEKGEKGNESKLNGHNFGNLFLTALRNILGSEEKAITEAHKILKVRGEVLPVTLESAHLCAVLENSEIIRGESLIDLPRENSNVRIKGVYLEPEANAYFGALEAIKNADAILIGPGDLFTSILPNLLAKGISEEIRKSNAIKIYNCNIMTKYGETNEFDVLEHLKFIGKYLGEKIINFVTYNTKKVSENILKEYKKEHAEPVKFDNKMSKKDITFIGRDLITEPNIIRHDPEKIASLIMEIVFNRAKF
jgi:uncharacterized cofD-like protein